jgi:hypothetical protein
LRVLNQALGAPLKSEERAVAPLAGGIMQYGYQCGMIWGAVLAAGAEAYRRFGAGPIADATAIRAARRIVDSFRNHKDHIDCYEITQIDRNSTTWQQISFFLLKGGTIGCLRMAAQYAKIAHREINAALSDTADAAPSRPVSCTAVLAQRMGASDMRTVMAAGLAGGIGLCGGACGALGAALWLRNAECLDTDDGKVSFNDPANQATIDRFLQYTDYQFRCAEIVGREFESVADHAAYVDGGGCEELIEHLSAV